MSGLEMLVAAFATVGLVVIWVAMGKAEKREAAEQVRLHRSWSKYRGTT